VVSFAKAERANFSHALEAEVKKIVRNLRGATSRTLSQEIPFALETGGVPKVFRHVFRAKGAVYSPLAWGSAPGFMSCKKALALKVRFTGHVIRPIVGTALIPRAECLGWRTITELNRAFSAWSPG
jgi:hypothetical protein